MNEVKDKMKGFVKKLNNPFGPSHKFKGEGQRLGSGVDLPAAASKIARPSTVGGKEKKGKSGDQKQQQEDWRKLQQERWERERRAEDLQSDPHAASTAGDGKGDVALRPVVPDSRGAGHAAVSLTSSQADLTSDHVFPNGSDAETVRVAFQGQNIAQESDAFEGRKHSSKDERISSFDPFSSQIGKYSNSNVSSPNMFQCPVCENWWRSEEEISTHVDDCLRASRSKPSTNSENDAKETDEISIQSKSFENADEEIQSATGVLLSGGPSSDTLDVLIRLLRNIVNSPASEKFRKIRMGNPKIHDTLGTAIGGVELLESLGFCLTTEGDEIWAKMKLPSESQVTAIEQVITKLETQLSQSSLSAASGFAQEEESLMVCRKIDRQLQVFHAVPENIAARIELPDSFFEVSAAELRQEAVARRKKLEDSQLLVPKSYREKQASSNRQMYNTSVIRIQFPDGIILQGMFLPKEPTTALYEFVSSALEDGSLEFELLFLATSKNPLIPCQSEVGMRVLTLEEADLVPTALVKFKPAANETKTFTGLRPDLMSRSVPLTSVAIPT
eukprot:c24858_g1_i1 orf=476-2152(-)